MIYQQFIAMVKARTMEFIRDRGTFFWSLLFPVFLVVGFAFAFNRPPEPVYTVLVQGSELSADLLGDFAKLPDVSIVTSLDTLEENIEKIRKHQIDMLIDPSSQRWWINEEGQHAGLLVYLANQDLQGFSQEEVLGKPIRYLDWVVPGVIAMNIMFSSLFGVGFVLVRYRKNGVLKRMKATPVSAINFIAAQAASRFMIVIATSVFVFLATHLVFNFMIEGSIFLLLLIASLGIISMISLGLVFASRIRSEELAGGILNLITFPMLILSGVFVSLENAPTLVQNLSNLLPLTHVLEAARAVMLDGASIAEIAGNLFALLGFSLGGILLAGFMFRWD